MPPSPGPGRHRPDLVVAGSSAALSAPGHHHRQRLGGAAGLNPAAGWSQSPPPAAILKYYFLAFLLVWLSGVGANRIIDPLPLHRSVNLAWPLSDNGLGVLSDEPRFYASAWLIGSCSSGGGLEPGLAPFFCASSASGALFGLLSRFSPGASGRPRISAAIAVSVRNTARGCRPRAKSSRRVRMCMNCLAAAPPAGSLCRSSSAAGRSGCRPVPARLHRGRAGLLVAPCGGRRAGWANRDPNLIRPPGAWTRRASWPAASGAANACASAPATSSSPLVGAGCRACGPGGQLPHRPQRLPANCIACARSAPLRPSALEPR